MKAEKEEQEDHHDAEQRELCQLVFTDSKKQQAEKEWKVEEEQTEEDNENCFFRKEWKRQNSLSTNKVKILHLNQWKII